MSIDRTAPTLSRWRISRLAPLAGLLLVGLVVGIVWANDYGMGADEYANAAVGHEALRAYTSAEAFGTFLERANLGHHGPSYFMLFAAVGDGLARLVPAWLPADGRHLSNYLTFLLAGASLYFLCLRLLPRPVALWTTAFFLTQPLLFGHGFINQKDTPFMAFFLTTVVVGLAGVDRLAASAAQARGSGQDGLGVWGQPRQDLRAAGWGWKLAFLAWAAGFAWLLLDLLVFGQILSAGKAILSTAHAGQAWEPINRLYEFVAEDAHKTGVAVYHAKLELGYWVAGRALMALLGAAMGFYLGRRAWPRTARAFLPGPVRAYGFLLVAAGLLGFTVSIRPLGGFAGLLVCGYLIHRLRWKALGPLLVFWAVAGLATYLTWPWLWPAPIERLIESVRYLADFDEQKLVLFRGRLFPSEAMPLDYLPVLLTIQLTEPVIPLAAVGLIVAYLDARRQPEHRPVLLLVAIWFAVITVLYMLPGSVHYNNFRHILFMLPALFVFFGYGLALLVKNVRPEWLRPVILMLLLIPGLLGLARLHPYEYAYYNAYAGGSSGANGKYHMDYWCLSLRKAQEYVNHVAPPGAVVFARRSLYSAIEYARPDLTMTKEEAERGGAAFVLVCTHYTEDAMTRGADRVFTETIGPAVAAEVWQVRLAPDTAP
ncbi:MAG: hypothetical protein MUO23_09080 [Anaerolineales bacterium]|nr:hypothetical protein [Anaerolineales bacterium]